MKGRLRLTEGEGGGGDEVQDEEGGERLKKYESSINNFIARPVQVSSPY